MAEWSKANGSKSFNRKLFVGSNPTLSVLITNQSCVNPTKELIMSFRCSWRGTLNFLMNYYYQSEKNVSQQIPCDSVFKWYFGVVHNWFKVLIQWSKLHMSNSGFPKIYPVIFSYYKLCCSEGYVHDSII